MPERGKGTEFSKHFEAFWAICWKRVGKTAAAKSWDKVVKTGIDPEWLLQRAQAFAASPKGQSGKFSPHPATWLNQGRYDDDDREWGLRTTFTYKAQGDTVKKHQDDLLLREVRRAAQNAPKNRAFIATWTPEEQERWARYAMVQCFDFRLDKRITEGTLETWPASYLQAMVDHHTRWYGAVE